MSVHKNHENLHPAKVSRYMILVERQLLGYVNRMLLWCLNSQLWCVHCSLHHKMGPSAALWVALLVACAHSPVTLDSLWLVHPVASAVQLLPGQAHSHFVGHYSVFLWNPLRMESSWLHVIVTTHQPAQLCALLCTQLMGLQYKHAFLIPKVVKCTGQNHQCVLVSLFIAISSYCQQDIWNF